MSLHKSNQFLTRSVFSLLFLATINPEITHAQIVPDGTLPTVVQQLQNMRKITGGERVGNNLFHSFEEFSIPAGTEAIFELTFHGISEKPFKSRFHPKPDSQ